MRFIDAYFYRPNFFQKCLAFLLLPISLLYLLIATLRRKMSPFKDFNLPIISVGNLVAGGSGKTPFIIEIANHYSKVAVISRGYKRKSKGLQVVSEWGEILCNQSQAGDEAFLIAKSLKKASVIVCEKREIAIKKAKDMGAEIIFLDDGFRFNYKKLNILLKPQLQPFFSFPIPSGIYRENPKLYQTADLLIEEGKDYQREVNLKNPTSAMLLVTAIANPSRLDAYLPQVVGKVILQDHSDFDPKFLVKKMKDLNATSLLVTQKDAVKLEQYNFNLSLLELKLKISSEVYSQIDRYIQNYYPDIKEHNPTKIR